MGAVIYCIKETNVKLNPSDKEHVKTTSLLRSPVVNSHLHRHQRPQKSHLSVSAATYLTPFSTYGRIISALSMAAGIFAPLFCVHPLTEMMRSTERRLIRIDVPDRPLPPTRSQGSAHPPPRRRPGLASLALGCFCSRELMRIICWDGAEGCHKELAQGVWEKIAAASSYAQTQPLMMSIKYECLRKHAKKEAHRYSFLISNLARSWSLLVVLFDNWRYIIPLTHPKIIVELFLFFKKGNINKLLNCFPLQHRWDQLLWLTSCFSLHCW